MHWQSTWYVLLLLITTGLSTSLAVYAWRRPTVAGTIPATLLLLALAEWCLAYALQLGSTDLPAKILWNKLRYLGILTVPSAWLVVSLRMTRMGKGLRRRHIVLLMVEPLITLLLIATNNWHGLMWRGFRLATSGRLTVLVPSFGPWVWVTAVYSYLLIALGALQFAVEFVRSPRVYRGQIGVLLVAGVPPWIANMLYLTNRSPLPGVDFTPFAFTLTGVALVGGLFQFQLLGIVPLARGAVIEDMRDGFVVLDTAERIVDLNLTAQRIMGCTADQAVGQPAAHVWAGWLDLRERLQGKTEGREEIILGDGETQRCYDVRISELTGQRDRFAGRLILLHDITERKQAERALRESEARYQDLYQNAPDLYDSIGPDGAILDINETGARMLGYTREELIGRHVSQIISPDFRERQQEEFARSQERQGPLEMEVPYRRKDGSTLWCHLRTEWMCDEAGHVLYTRGVARDITERKRAEEALRQSEQKFRGIVEQSLDGIVLIDQQGLIVEWNRGQERIVGLKQAEVIGRPAWDVQAQVVPEERKTDEWYERTKTSMQQFLKTGQAPWLNQLQEINIQHPDGTSRTIQQLSFLIQTDKGFMLGSIVRDVTEQKSVWEEARLKARRQAALVQFSADLAATLDVEEICHRVVQGLHDTLGYTYQGIFLVDETTGERVCRASMGWPDAPANWRIPPGQGITERALLDGQLHYTPDVTQDPDYVPGLGSGAEVDVPIYVGGKVIGVLVVESREPNAFGPDDFEVIEAAANQAGIAMSNARSLEVAQRRAQEAETLRQAGAVVAATLQQDETIQHILEQLEHVVPYDSASVQLLHEGYVEIVGGRGWADPAAVVGLRFPVSADNPNTVVIQERRPYILGDAPAVYAPFREDSHSHIRSWLGVPLIVGDRVIGMLTVDSTQPNHFTPRHARLATAFADQVAIALENARLFEAEQRRRKVAAALLEITQVAGSSLELKQILKRIARLTAGACQTDRCSIFLLDEAGECLQPVMSQFADGHVEPEMWRCFKATAADRVDAVPLFRDAIRERRPALLGDSTRTDLIPRKWTQPFHIQKLLVVPLISHERVIGLMALDYTDADREFTPEQIELAQTIGGQVAVSIENAQLYARTQQLAITDSLTGLYNRRGFFELGRREVERARRFGRPLTAIMFDLDHFKRVNDAYGHPIGDQVLAGLAELCQQALRDVDLLGRYGGEEFAVLLPESGLTIARPVAERLRRRVEQAAIDTDRGPMAITISLGVAMLDETCADLEALLERADQALYAAKQTGRNRVCVWQR